MDEFNRKKWEEKLRIVKITKGLQISPVQNKKKIPEILISWFACQTLEVKVCDYGFA